MKILSIAFPCLGMAFVAFFLVSCNAAPDIVRDMNGDILREGANYYIYMPVDHGKAGAVTLWSRNGSACPLDVVQSKYGTDKRYLNIFSFTPVNLKKGVVRESTDLNIEAAGGSFCGEPMVWKLDSYGGEFVVSTRGVKGNPGAKTIGNWFKIEKYLNHYKFVYCPSVCKTCKAMCKDIGISRKGKSGRLVLNDKPFMVSFKKF